MSQFFKVFNFEFTEYLKNKVFKVVTIIGVVVIIITSFLPNILGLFSFDLSGGKTQNILISGAPVGDESFINTAFKGNVNLTFDNMDENTIRDQVKNKNYDSALIFKGDSNYLYISSKGLMGDPLSATISELTSKYQTLKKMNELGLSNDQSINALYQTTNVDIQSVTGDNQIAGYILAYVMMILMFTAIMVYGQLVSASIASEKSTKTMEVLITYAEPKSLFFGKVFASCFAGLFQLLIFIMTILIITIFNFKSLFEIPIVKSILIQIGYLFPYFIMFFLFGFLSFAFLFGAIASIVSRIEDVNTAATPVVLLAIAVYMIGILSLSQISGSITNIFSFIPFFSPIIMFSRICMSTASIFEILISIPINILTILVSGFIGTKIYKTGVLLYGLRPSLKNIVKMIKK